MKQRGFTLIELMIATTVFAVLLIIVAFAVLRVGQVYYKGFNMARTQDVTRSIMDEVIQSIQMSGPGAVEEPEETLPTGQGAYCIGQLNHFIFQLDTVQEAGEDSVFTGYSSVNAPCVLSEITKGTARPLLGDKMRLQEFTIEPIGTVGANKLYRVLLRVAYGENDLLDENGNCRPGFGSQFCAVSQLETVTSRRL